MDDRYHEFENFLRGFNPVKPSASPRSRNSESMWVPRSLALATLTLAATLAVYLLAKQPQVLETNSPARYSSVGLTRLAVENPDRFNRVVERGRLPRFDQPGRALHSLARE